MNGAFQVKLCVSACACVRVSHISQVFFFFSKFWVQCGTGHEGEAVMEDVEMDVACRRLYIFGVHVVVASSLDLEGLGRSCWESRKQNLVRRAGRCSVEALVGPGVAGGRVVAPVAEIMVARIARENDLQNRASVSLIDPIWAYVVNRTDGIYKSLSGGSLGRSIGVIKQQRPTRRTTRRRRREKRPRRRHRPQKHRTQQTGATDKRPQTKHHADHTTPHTHTPPPPSPLNTCTDFSTTTFALFSTIYVSLLFVLSLTCCFASV